MTTIIKNLTSCFLKEWSLYVEDTPRAGIVYKFSSVTSTINSRNSLELSGLNRSRRARAGGLDVSGGVDFPGKLQIGQIRLLADVEPALMVYVFGKVGLGFSWKIIPLSPFHFPATSGEALIGTHVYQFWNQQTIPNAILARSFVVDTVAKDERREIGQVQKFLEDGSPLPEYLRPAIGSPIRTDKDVRLRYLKDFSIDEETFRSTRKDNSFVNLTRLLILRAFSEHEGVAAAADVEGDYTTAVVADRFPRNAKDFKSKYVECELRSQFLSLLPGERGERPLVYTWDDETPASWNNSAVAAYIAKTGELFGTGVMDVKLKRIVIDDFSVSDGISVPLEKASELRLVMVPPKG